LPICCTCSARPIETGPAGRNAELQLDAVILRPGIPSGGAGAARSLESVRRPVNSLVGKARAPTPLTLQIGPGRKYFAK
jgi:hypothetical protein